MIKIGLIFVPMGCKPIGTFVIISEDGRFVSYTSSVTAIAVTPSPQGGGYICT